MTRKKFVKQLMALGYQRNEAEDLAMYARWGRWTYESYLQIEKNSKARQRAMENITLTFTNMLTPAVKAAQQAIERMSEAVAGIKWEVPDLSTLWTTKQVEEALLPEWPKENPHRCDAVDVLRYVCGIDLAAGPDMTVHLDGLRTDWAMVDEWDSLPSDKLHDQAMSACAGGGGHE